MAKLYYEKDCEANTGNRDSGFNTWVDIQLAGKQ